MGWLLSSSWDPTTSIRLCSPWRLPPPTVETTCCLSARCLCCLSLAFARAQYYSSFVGSVSRFICLQNVLCRLSIGRLKKHANISFGIFLRMHCLWYLLYSLPLYIICLPFFFLFFILSCFSWQANDVGVAAPLPVNPPFRFCLCGASAPFFQTLFGWLTALRVSSLSSAILDTFYSQRVGCSQRVIVYSPSVDCCGL